MKRLKISLCPDYHRHRIGYRIRKRSSRRTGESICDFQRDLQRVPGFHHSVDYSRAGHSRHCRYRQGGGKDAGNHNVGSIQRHVVLRFPVLFHRSDFFPFHDYSGSTDRTNQRGTRYFSILHCSHPPVMNVMTSLILAFTLGLGIAHLDSTALKNVCNDFKEIIVKTIQTVILPLLPIYIFGIFLNMTHSGQVYNILMVFIKIIGVIFLLHIFLLVFQYTIAALFVHRNPFKLLGKMMPAYFRALGTQSSAATIPVTLRQTIKNGVTEDIAGFVIPLCATIHLSGSTLKIVACALALMIMQGMPLDFPMFAGFIFMGITMVAAGSTGGHHGCIGDPVFHAGIRRKRTGFDDSTVHCHG